MRLPTASVVAFLALLYFGPGLLFLGLACDASSEDHADWSAVLTTEDEPGDQLHVRGTVFGPDGETPIAGASVYVYHTDAQGLYSETNDNTNPRLHATLVTDGEGRYEFHTIRPASYPGGGVAAHVHYRVSSEDHPEQRFELHFEGDPALSERARAHSARAGDFGSIRPLARGDDGTWRCVFNLRLGR